MTSIDPFAAELMESYLSGRREDIRLLERAWGNHNFGLIRMIGHNLYGSGGAYGVEELSEIGQRLEQAAESQNLEGIGINLEALKQAIKRLQRD